ncbi:MAG: GNAT family N-acetyltransferase, partial [Myxococcaceae bacterium]|nr:GNAT family N-acetyltransferase [Myxococcaceae bacterium]
MSGFPPPGFRLELLDRSHRRRQFSSGDRRVDEWLQRKALPAIEKHTSTTRVLLHDDVIAGYYTLANTALDVSLIPPELLGGKPATRPAPTVTVAWLGVDERFRGHGLGTQLFARSLSDCVRAWQLVRFVTVMVDALTEQNHAFYRAHGFTPVPETTHKLYLPSSTLLDII